MEGNDQSEDTISHSFEENREHNTKGNESAKRRENESVSDEVSTFLLLIEGRETFFGWLFFGIRSEW